MDRVEAVVVGAGVVGLAVARELVRRGKQPLVLEAAAHIGAGTSSRHSEVIHAGMYYPRGLLKARLCVRGKALLYAYAEEQGVPHRRCGKLIVATEEGQGSQLDAIDAAARVNGVADLVRLTPEEARELEPEVRCTAALLSPSTGIVDSHTLMVAFQGDVENGGGAVAFRSPVVSAGAAGAGDGGGYRVDVGGDTPFSLLCDTFVNAAGLTATQLARACSAGGGGGGAKGLGLPDPPTPHYAKGSYYALHGRGSPFSRLVYPVPEPGTAGLGVHATVNLAGQTRFGPDVQWIDAEAARAGVTADAFPDQLYDVDARRADGFYEAIRRYWPALADGQLQPDYSGVRPKIAGPGEPAADFRVDVARGDGGCGAAALYGIESPGLTSSMAIAEHVCDALGL